MFEYTLKFQKTEAHANADALSRLPLLVTSPLKTGPTELVLLTQHLQDSPVSAEQIREQTAKDPILAPVVQFLKQGWPMFMEKSSLLMPFFHRSSELSLFDGCILWGSRVVIPSAHREAILAELHKRYQGMVRMKALARSYVWWPGITGDIETAVHLQLCTECHSLLQPPHHYICGNGQNYPGQDCIWTMQVLHVQGKMYLVRMNAYSKWIEAFYTPTATSAAVIEELRPLFTKFGIPKTMVTNNGTFRWCEIQELSSFKQYQAYHICIVAKFSKILTWTYCLT